MLLKALCQELKVRCKCQHSALFIIPGMWKSETYCIGIYETLWLGKIDFSERKCLYFEVLKGLVYH